jgi:hypothetical protein
VTTRGIFTDTNQNSVNGIHSFAPCKSVSVKRPNVQDEGVFSVSFSSQVSRADCRSAVLVKGARGVLTRTVERRIQLY